jgi:hypothetical protein
MGYQDDDLEVMEPEQVDLGALAVLNKSEVEMQVTTARKFPRSIKKFTNEALQLATLDEATAGECLYALPRKDKDGCNITIEGPSARLAEIIAYSWGNNRAGARVIGEDEEFVTAQGVYYDLEKNSAISFEVKRRITNKHGKRFNSDMIGVTANAASSIALRNAVLKGIPKALWKPIYDAVRSTIAGDSRTLTNRRIAAIKAFAVHGVSEDMILVALGISGVQDITLDHLVALRAMLTALKDGESTVEDMFPEEPKAANGKAPEPPKSTTQAVKEKVLAKVREREAAKDAKAADPKVQEQQWATEAQPPKPEDEDQSAGLFIQDSDFAARERGETR